MCVINPPPGTCSVDKDCGGKQLCCDTQCAGKECTKDFIIVKPGECPTFSMDCATATDPCTSDGQCSGLQKCCQSDCGVRNCTRPVCTPLAGLKCKSKCSFGNQKNYFGCDTCKCKVNPCKAKKCGKGNVCKLVQVQCFAAPCYPVAECVAKKACPVQTCPGMCKLGFAKDKNGCDTCTCNTEPGTGTGTGTGTGCGPVCEIACQYGNVLDAKGCPTCSCNPAPVPAPDSTPDNPKSGNCPPFLMKCLTTMTGCTNDQQCPGLKKCCQIQCGPRNCTQPV